MVQQNLTIGDGNTSALRNMTHGIIALEGRIQTIYNLIIVLLIAVIAVFLVQIGFAIHGLLTKQTKKQLTQVVIQEPKKKKDENDEKKKEEEEEEDEPPREPSKTLTINVEIDENQPKTMPVVSSSTDFTSLRPEIKQQLAKEIAPQYKPPPPPSFFSDPIKQIPSSTISPGIQTTSTPSSPGVSTARNTATSPASILTTAIPK